MAIDLSHLNPEQREAAEHVEGPLLVLAGAGSGKTRVLTHRIARLVEDVGVDARAVLALTFTNKAAGEMRERVRTLLGRDPGGMWVGTFHAIGARILRRHAGRLGWTPGFLVYDAADQENLMKRIVKDQLQLDPKRWSPRAFLSAVSSAKNELVGVQAYAEQALDVFAQKVAQAYALYQQALKDANAFDFDDLLVKPVELLRAHPGVLREYRDRFAFVLVDEYQDTNHAQYVFLTLLAQEHENLFVVGDDDQSIYGWRGADIRNILDFEKDFPAARVVRLEQNYRSSQTILAAANRVIAENVRRKGKTLRTENAPGERLTLVEAADESDEAEWIAAEVRARMEDDPALALRDFVVLYRTNAQSRAMEEALRRAAMPYRVIGGTRFYERREVKDALAYLRLVANPAADEPFLRVVNVPRRGVGETSLGRFRGHAMSSKISLLAAAEMIEDSGVLRGNAAKGLASFATLIRKFSVQADRAVPLDELLRDLIRESGLVDALKEEGPEGEDRIKNLDELVAGAADFQTRLDNEDPDLMMELEEAGTEASPRPLDQFLGHVSLVADIDQHDPSADAVSLMTLHNAKGLEFPIVLIGGLEEGLFPLIRAEIEPEQLEEERRLFYVGITRAERKLYLSHARRRRRGGEWMDSAPSSFLEAVPDELVERRRTPRMLERASWSGARPWRGGGDGFRSRSERLGFGASFPGASPAPAAAAADEDPSYQVDYSDSQEMVSLRKGARVRHPNFGAGTVAELSGVGAGVAAVIDFDAETVGRKKVLLKYANLQREWD